jgi:outer membrane protein OmpA-like peptidoglycan-associated protein
VATASARALACLALGVALALGPAATASAQGFDPDAPVPPGSVFTILDLQFQTEPLAGAVQALDVRETATDIRIGLAADVLFDFDKSEIRADAAPMLAKAAEIVRQHGQRRVTIEGHTDGKGAAAYNQRLSERRAAAVRGWLAAQGGLEGMPMTTRGWGATRPVAPNAKPDGSDNPEGRQQNRRVEIVIAK